MAYRGGRHDKTTKRMSGCGSKSAQRRARKRNCNHGPRVSYAARKEKNGDLQRD